MTAQSLNSLAASTFVLPSQGVAPSEGAPLPSAPGVPSGGSSPSNPIQYNVPGTPVVVQPPAYQPPGVTPPPAPDTTVYRAHLDRMEADGKIPRGQFKDDAELLQALYSVADQSLNELERLKSSQGSPPVAPPGSPALASGNPGVSAPPPQVTPAAVTASNQDVTRAAMALQQQGLLTFTNGQWIATSPVAGDIAAKMNQAALDIQAKTAELADPGAFIQKYGTEAIQAAVKPLQEQLEAVRKQNIELEQRLRASIPKPYEGWLKENQKHLKTVDGQLTEAGQAYSMAWDAGVANGVTSEQTLHQKAVEWATRFMPKSPEQAQPNPAASQSFLSTVGQTPVTPGFNAPGSTFAKQGNPNGVNVPVTNKGLPDFNEMQRQYLAGQLQG